MKRSLPVLAAITLCAGAMFMTHRSSAADETPEELIAKARSLVSYSLAGPFELDANLEIVQQNGKKQKGVYILDWAAPDKFREEIHIPGYDEVKIASGTTLYRKQSTVDQPLRAYQIEALMNQDAVLNGFQSALISYMKLKATAVSAGDQPWPSPKVVTMGPGSPWYEKCVSVSWGEVCIDPEHEWPFEIVPAGLGNSPLIEYADYRKFHGGFYPSNRRFMERGVTIIQADVKKMSSMRDFSADAFTLPQDAQTISWCPGEITPQRLPLKPLLPLPWEDFPDPEVFFGVVNANGTLDKAVILESGGPKADADLRKFASQLAFSPATCDGKPVQSEGVFALDAGDVQGGLGNIPDAGKNGYTVPTCVRCPDPHYSDEGFKNKVQGAVVLMVVVSTDGRAHVVAMRRRLGYGLDQEAINAIQNVYRLKPALGPDGKPAAVRMEIEVDFRIYSGRIRF
jgi:hypothetical protein